MIRHRWWHDHVADQYFAVAVDERGEIVSAWMQVAGNRWEAIDALDGFGRLEQADQRGEIHKNADGTDELSSSLGPVQ